MKLDHVTIVTHDLERARRFFVDVVELREGARPPLGVDGHWLYDDSQKAVHLVAASGQASPARSVPRIDHFAFRMNGENAWHALRARVEASGLRCGIARVPASDDVQLFVEAAPGLTVEFLLHSPGEGSTETPR